MSVLEQSVDPLFMLLGLLGVAVIRSVMKYAITRMVLNKMADGQELAPVLLALAQFFGASTGSEPASPKSPSSEPALHAERGEPRDDGCADPSLEA